MNRILTIIFSAGLLLLIPWQSVPGQTGEESSEYINEEKRWLRGDLRIADVVAYVDVREVKFADSTGGNVDCENNRGNGYCTYLLIAEIKEFFKGKSKSKKIEFYVGAEATYPKKGLFGEQIVFLVRSENEKTGKTSLGTIENSTRRTDHLDVMRKIVDPNAPIDDADGGDPYSFEALKKDFEEADAVVYANVTSFKPSSDEFAVDASVMEAEANEVFKGEFKAGQTIEYTEDLLYRPVRREDLGKQVLFLKRNEEDGKISYEHTRYTITAIEHNALEKLRKISAKK